VSDVVSRRSIFLNVMAGLDPAIQSQVAAAAGCPGQARAWHRSGKREL